MIHTTSAAETADAVRPAFSLLGALPAALLPTLPYLLLATVMILLDCRSAWRLGRRVARAHPERVGAGAYKFSSGAFGRTLSTIIRAWTLIVLAFFIQRYITAGMPFDLTKIAAGAVCFWQGWSILENESSCNGSRLARLLQRIMVDKTARHFDIDLSPLTDLKDLKDLKDLNNSPDKL